MQKGEYAWTKKNDIGTLGQKILTMSFLWGPNFAKKSIFLIFVRRLGPGPLKRRLWGGPMGSAHGPKMGPIFPKYLF